jgi:hypothetical protein
LLPESDFECTLWGEEEEVQEESWILPWDEEESLGERGNTSLDNEQLGRDGDETRRMLLQSQDCFEQDAGSRRLDSSWKSKI